MAPPWSELFHILNPSAARRPGVQAFFDGVPWQRIWIDRTSHPTHLETAVQWAINEGRSEFAVWGGDGTFSRVLNALADYGALDRARVALVPSGTCNDFARKLNIGPWERVAGRANLAERTVDVGALQHAEGTRLFLNNAGFGRRPAARTEKRPHPVADIFRLSPVPLEVEWHRGEASGKVETRALLGIVFNAPYFGGGLHFSTAVSPDDGQLDGFFLSDQPRWKVLWSFMRARNGRPLANAGTVPVSGGSIRVWTSGALFPQADGEKASERGVKEIVFRAVPRALTLLVPNDSLNAR